MTRFGRPDQKYLRFIFILQIFLFATFLPEAKSYQLGKIYYVSMSGDNNNNGSLESSWRTIQKAADTVAPGDTVLIQPGIYRESVVLRRSGTDAAPIVFKANDGIWQQGEQAVRLWGSEDSRQMTWHDLNTAACDASRFPAVTPANYGKIFCTDLSGSAWQVGNDYIIPDIVTQIAQNGVINRLTKAREPDVKVVTPWKHHEFWWTAEGGTPNGGTSSTSLFDATNDTLPTGLEAGNLATLGNLSGGTMFMVDNVAGFYQYRRQIQQMLPTGCNSGVDCRGVQLETQSGESRAVDFDFGLDDGLGPATKYYVEGVPQLLDQPGEWVYDLNSKKLYVWSVSSPATQQLEIAKRHVGLTFSDPQNGSSSASHITLDGLSIELINANYRYQPDTGQIILRSMLNFNALEPANIQGALTLFNRVGTASSGLTLTNLRVSQASNGLQFFQEAAPLVKARTITLANSEFATIDGQAIRIHAEINGVAANFPAIDGLALQGNHIHHVGFRPNEIWLDNGVGISLLTEGIQHLTISDNIVEDIGHNGLSMEQPAPGNLPQKLIIKNNTIRRACQNGSDCAAVYLWSEGLPFNTVSLVENVLEDNQGWSYVLNACQPPYSLPGGLACQEQWWPGGQAGHGIYPDRAGGLVVYRNLIRNNGFAGVYLSTAESRSGATLIYNNIIDNARYGLALKEGDQFVDLKIKNNIFYNNREAAILLNNAVGNLEIDYNFYKNSEAGVAWRLDGLPVTHLAEANTDRFESHGLEYDGQIFLQEPPLTKANYYPRPDAKIIDGGDIVPDLPGVTQAQDYPAVGDTYDIGLWEFGGSNAPPATGFDLQPRQTDPQVGATIDQGTMQVSGSVTYQGRKSHPDIVVSLLNLLDKEVTTADNGQFGIEGLAEGSYTLQADQALYLPSCQTITIVPGETVTLPSTVLAGGDTDDNDQIKINDATLIGSNFGLSNTSPTPMNAQADINTDGRINVLDLTIMASNFGKEGCQAWDAATPTPLASTP